MIEKPRLTTLDPRASTLDKDFAADVRRDLALTPKQLQSKYLYDALGSSLFEAICRLPWYRITRAERGLLHRHAPEIVERLAQLGYLPIGGAPSVYADNLKSEIAKWGEVVARANVRIEQ